jgi:cytochrome P450
MLYACQDRYGDMFTIRVAYEGTWVMLADPAAIKQVFTGDSRVFHAGEGNEILAPLLGRNSLLVLDEKRHISQRKLLLPPFHGERMQGYAQTMGEIAEREIAERRRAGDVSERDDVLSMMIGAHHETAAR